MEPRERIEAALEREGWTASSWREEDGRPVAVIGKAVVIEEDEDAGLFADDEGELTAEVVGAVQYHNERVCFAFKPEGTDGGSEVRDLSMIERST